MARGGVGLAWWGMVGSRRAAPAEPIPVLGVGSAGLHVLENIGVGEHFKKTLFPNREKSLKKNIGKRKDY